MVKAPMNSSGFRTWCLLNSHGIHEMPTDKPFFFSASKCLQKTWFEPAKSCINAATNEECNLNSEVCTPEADSCQNEIRIHSGVKRITKRCKQGLACHNNYRQNPPIYLLDYFAQPQNQHQCNGGIENSVCRCCCSGNYCNWAEKPCTGRYDCNAVSELTLKRK